MILSYKNSQVHFCTEGKGRAVVLLHGFLENLSMWENVAATLSERYRVVCIDLAGHGKTGNQGYIHRVEDQADLVRAVLAKLRLRKYVLVGHSMGGYVALALAKQYPNNIKGLCLMNSTASPDSPEKRQHRDRAVRTVKKHPQSFVKMAIPQLFSEENRERYSTEIKQLISEACKMSVQGMVAALEGMKIRDDFRSVYREERFPVMLMAGTKDPVLTYPELVEQVRGTRAELRSYQGGHMSHLENTDACIRDLTGFLKKCYY